ncbi:MarR family winged helix-turn-helix transcriptional regulator [Salinimicrobium oceani]|uniref:MarR family transcriptional regulator n=1 Tax=Salinimicrobium oceani TaxID=2722702 RepID=A0ABX1CXL1_9FLAO|nr:MarR family transcriptional regulator [Salinimicrobium oceani]NJW52537.1 MarR family transcriptional regulator [Salinimicrobium oceani]
MIEEKKNIELFNRAAVIELVVSGNWVQERLADALKPFNISIAQFNVLRILRGQKGKPASLACVNAKMIHKMSNTTRLIDKLMEKELVERITCPANRRKIELTITEKGLDLLKQLDKVIDTAEAQAMESLSKNELTTLTALLQKLKK